MTLLQPLRKATLTSFDMEKDKSARIAGISRLRIETDGPGIRTLVPLSGCLLDCAYCINDRLRGASVGEEYTPDKLLDLVRLDAIYFMATGGGITFGGGEPLLRSKFIRHFKEICPPEWTIAVETSLNVPKGDVEALLEYVDFWIVDIKDMDPERYLEYTGETNERVLANLETLRAQCDVSKILIRVPRIPGLNGAEEVDRSADIIREMGFETEVFDYAIPENFRNQFSDRKILTGSLIDSSDADPESDRERGKVRHRYLKNFYDILTTPLVGAICSNEYWTD